jgi:hypothetical protein
MNLAGIAFAGTVRNCSWSASTPGERYDGGSGRSGRSGEWRERYGVAGAGAGRSGGVAGAGAGAGVGDCCAPETEAMIATIDPTTATELAMESSAKLDGHF